MAMTVISSDDFELGNNGRVMGGCATLMDKHNKPIHYSLSQLSYLKELDRILHYANTPSLTALAQKAGTLAVSSAFFVGGSVTGGVMSALMGNDLAEKTAERHRQKVVKTTYVLQIN